MISHPPAYPCSAWAQTSTTPNRQTPDQRVAGQVAEDGDVGRWPAVQTEVDVGLRGVLTPGSAPAEHHSADPWNPAQPHRKRPQLFVVHRHIVPDAQLWVRQDVKVPADQPGIDAEGSNAASGDAGAEAVFSDITSRLTAVLADGLLGLYAHGSWVSGDFAPSRSDLDVLAVLSDQPDESLLSVLADTHARLEADHPQWAGRIEVEYASLATIEAFAADPGLADGHMIARISPGEQLHPLPATSHRLLTWATVRDRGHPLHGPAPSTLLPPVSVEVVTAAVLDHVRDWPDWVHDMTNPGARSYAVLTVCRALHLVRTGRQVSKRRAADYAVTELPEWAELIRWARDWWYAGGSDEEDSGHPETIRFVEDLSARILRDQE